MAGLPQRDHATSEDVRVAELRAGEIKVVEICRTIRRLGYAICGATAVGLIAWTAVEISTSPTSWARVALAAVTPSGVIFAIYEAIRRRARRRRIQLEADIRKLTEGQTGG